VSGSLDDCVEKDGTFYITKDATYGRWNLLPLFLSNKPGTGLIKENSVKVLFKILLNSVCPLGPYCALGIV
jgi:hypothetical protein